MEDNKSIEEEKKLPYVVFFLSVFVLILFGVGPII